MLGEATVTPRRATRRHLTQYVHHWPGVASGEALEMAIFPSKVLLATDGSAQAELATRAAIELADATGSELHLVHVGVVPNCLVLLR